MGCLNRHDGVKTQANLIQRARLAKGLTVEQLASGVRLSAQTIRFYEEGVYRPSRAMLALIGEALDELLDDRESPESGRTPN
jgi:transcriptional regulator with XRE-family HTH domain